MKIHHEGRGPILTGLLILLALALISYIVSFNLVVSLLILIPIFILNLLIMWFFRIPDRISAKDEKLVIAPADGKIVVIENIVEDEYFKDERIQISIFMSPLNVHQNVSPIDGQIIYNQYHKGKYLVAWHPKSSTQNERTTIVIKHKNGMEILVRLIAGAVARRICSYSKVGDYVEQCAEIGFIKFGSRVDVILPVDARVVCNLHQNAVNKRTILAELN